MVAGIIQARMASTRLPGKALIEICGKPLLQHLVERIKQSKLVDKIIVATTEKPEDGNIEELSKALGVNVFRGSEKDVLDRFYKCAEKFSVDIVARITADDPFKDPFIIDRAIQILKSDRTLDYVSNALKPTYPEGLDIEVFKFEALEIAWNESNKVSEREHVTPYIYNNPNIFSLYNFENEINLSDLRWTLDTQADLEFTEEIYKRLYSPGKPFFMADILDLLRKEPWLKKINSGIERNAGYKKSISKESK